MQNKPEHYGASYAETFKNSQVVDSYRHRPPYPAEVFTILAGLVTAEPRAVLDVGAGSGDLARRMVEFVERVDAVDFSQHMIARGKQLAGGDHPRLNWIYGKVEEVPLTPPYALITAGSSIHWTDWPVAFPRFRALLAPGGSLALVYRRTLPMSWDRDLQELRARFATHQRRGSWNVVPQLEQRGFFQKQGEKETAPIPFNQSIEDFINGLHSRSSFARELMGQQAAENFDQQARQLLLRFHPDGWLPLQVVGLVVWGTPENGALAST